MYDAIYQRLEKLATWPGVGMLFVICMVLTIGFTLRQRELGLSNPGLDGRMWYTPEAASKFFQDIGKDGRQLYAATQLSLDVLFPLAYSSLMAVLLINLYAPAGGRTWTVLVPLLAALFDLAENVTVAGLALSYEGKEQPLARLAAVFTLTKTCLLFLSLGLIAVGAWKAWPRRG